MDEWMDRWTDEQMIRYQICLSRKSEKQENLPFQNCKKNPQDGTAAPVDGACNKKQSDRRFVNWIRAKGLKVERPNPWRNWAFFTTRSWDSKDDNLGSPYLGPRVCILCLYIYIIFIYIYNLYIYIKIFKMLLRQMKCSIIMIKE